MPLADAPPLVVKTVLAASSLIGDGFYGNGLKETEGGFVIEITDNPNIDHGVEDAALKDALYTAISQDFIRRIEAR